MRQRNCTRLRQIMEEAIPIAQQIMHFSDHPMIKRIMEGVAEDANTEVNAFARALVVVVIVYSFVAIS